MALVIQVDAPALHPQKTILSPGLQYCSICGDRRIDATAEECEACGGTGTVPTFDSAVDRKADLDERNQTAVLLRSMIRDLEARIEGSAWNVQRVQGVKVAKTFRAAATAVVLQFGNLEGVILSVPEEQLAAVREHLAATREAILTTMATARGAPVATWKWPPLTFTDDNDGAPLTDVTSAGLRDIIESLSE